MPDALLKRAESESIAAPRLRVHPHIMAATYRKGAEYHCHKDSYAGTDNSRTSTAIGNQTCTIISPCRYIPIAFSE